MITNEGVKLLATNPSIVNMKTLEHYDSYNLWQTAGKQEGNEVSNQANNNCEVELTPDETIGKAYEELRSILANELLDKILEQSPYFFEKLVIRLLVAMGYGGSFNEITEMMVGKTGDEGIDGVIKEDRLGLDNIYVQAKRWDKTKTVGRPDIQQFVGDVHADGHDAPDQTLGHGSRQCGDEVQHDRRFSLQKVIDFNSIAKHGGKGKSLFRRIRLFFVENGGIRRWPRIPRAG